MADKAEVQGIMGRVGGGGDYFRDPYLSTLNVSPLEASEGLFFFLRGFVKK